MNHLDKTSHTAAVVVFVSLAKERESTKAVDHDHKGRTNQVKEINPDVFHGICGYGCGRKIGLKWL